ncbi:MAG: diphosphate--fructose-6-phosphate 1-phosphotransferase [Oscillospiraceae bacterium]|nr:diphosphate--fructose-6-phosphate 1-phosphotransferase [Oscillospiraceae bacterium]
MAYNILIAHGGGPTAVINSSLRGLIEAARGSGRVDRIYAAQFGAEGLLQNRLIDLTDIPASETERLSFTPASAIGSCRRRLCEADFPAVLDCLIKNEVKAFFYNGGNDSMDTCDKISRLISREKLDIKVIGIPKTIDNDLDVTDHCPGYGSAARYAAICSSELALDASALPIHVVVLELMGRNAGWITAAGALASRLTPCEQLVYLPELGVDMDGMLADIEDRYSRGRGLLVTVSEGLCDRSGRPLAETGVVDGFGHSVPGGTAQYISTQIIERLKIKSRAEKPGLLGRTSMAYVSETDRREAYGVGRAALDFALAGETGGMVAISADRAGGYTSDMFLTPLAAVANVEKKFPRGWIIDGNCVSEEFFDYALPLLGGELPQYCNLRRY